MAKVARKGKSSEWPLATPHQANTTPPSHGEVDTHLPHQGGWSLASGVHSPSPQERNMVEVTWALKWWSSTFKLIKNISNIFCHSYHQESRPKESCPKESRQGRQETSCQEGRQKTSQESRWKEIRQEMRWFDFENHNVSFLNIH